jgi:hypothetical protein
MRHTVRLAIAHALIAASLQLLAAPAVAAIAAGGRGAVLEGLVVGVDGTAARAHRVHLIDGQGRDVAQSTTTSDGAYSFRAVAPGSYALGVENPAGLIAAVAAPPLELGRADLARRDIRLLEGDLGQASAQVQANYGLGQWWAGLSSAAKVWTIIGIVAVVGITIAALDDDDDDEEPASAF